MGVQIKARSYKGTVVENVRFVNMEYAGKNVVGGLIGATVGRMGEGDPGKRQRVSGRDHQRVAEIFRRLRTGSRGGNPCSDQLTRRTEYRKDRGLNSRGLPYEGVCL